MISPRTEVENNQGVRKNVTVHGYRHSGMNCRNDDTMEGNLNRSPILWLPLPGTRSRLPCRDDSISGYVLNGYPQTNDTVS